MNGDTTPSLRLELPYCAQYAPTSRASCKTCSKVIEKDELKIANKVQSRFHDGMDKKFHHVECFFGKYRPKSSGDIDKFGMLKFEDQKMIEKLIASSTGRIDTVSLSEFNVEYAKSGGSKCTRCEEKISKNEVRISKLDHDSQRAQMYGAFPRWFHVDCFVENRSDLDFYESATKIPNFKKLEADDQKMVKKKLQKVAVKRDSKVKEEKNNDVSPPKKQKMKEEKALKKQSDDYYKMVDNIKSMKNVHIKLLLEENNQHVAKSNDSRINRLADCLTFGALKTCPECKTGHLTARNNGYICSGHATNFAPCLYETTSPTRTNMKISETLKKEYDFLKKHKSKIKEKINKEVKASCDAIDLVASVLNIEPDGVNGADVKKEDDNEKVLNGHKVVVVGRLVKPKKDINTIIKSLGGTIENDVTRTILFVIANQKAVDNDNEKVKKAENNGVHVVSDAILDYLKEGLKKNEIIDLIVKNILIGDGNNIEKKFNARSNFSEKMKSGYKSRSMAKNQFSKSAMIGSQKVTIKDGLAVDPDSDLDHCAHVLQEKDERNQNAIYSVVLNKVDLLQKKNSFYKIQLLKSDTNNQDYWIFRSWGRIGSIIGGKMIVDFKSKAQALNHFSEIYYENTGNEWLDRDNFVAVPGKYHPVEISYGRPKSNEMVKMEPGSNSKLDLPLQHLLSLIFDISSMKKQMKEYHLDLEKMPLGKISLNQILKAYSVLSEIYNYIEAKETNPTKLIDATTRFYTLVPHEIAVQQGSIINSIKLVEEKREMLETLQKMEEAFDLINDIKVEQGEDPFEHHYNKLKCNLELMDESCDEYITIKRYIENTHAATHTSYKIKLQHVFRVVRDGEGDRYNKKASKIKNKMLLWHGSRTTNFAGILSQGLRIAPPEAPVTGYMFGKGIYFADMVSKSANYCYPSSMNPDGLLLLSEVALGNMWELTSAKDVTKKILPKGKSSVKGVGRTSPDPNDFVKIENAHVPYGKGIEEKGKHCSLLYNEYVVYDEAQVNIKYLLKVEFECKY